MSQNLMRIYAHEGTKNSDPKEILTYTWEGKLHHVQEDVLCSNSRGTLDELAQNLAYNIKNHPSKQHSLAGLSAYRVDFQIGELPLSSDRKRDLTFAEQVEFFEAFRKYISQKAHYSPEDSSVDIEVEKRR